ncbi:3'-5' exonuclease [Methylotenera mobilis]|uniref:3'-5' exonuclease n=1 Tax=Methylotenera mobilis TaxID=359408 RepID=UPI000373B0A0|nr:3'-5' exonuclease [Methylotenera mobilis]PPC97728.1 MAG: DNA polymerase III subunit epsilon [Methylotenera sp.]
MINDSAVTDAVTLLDENPDYKVIRRLSSRKSFAENDGRPLLRGVVVDTETTGTNPDQDAIIELGMVLFEFDPQTGVAYNVLGSFDELEYPGFPIPPDSISVHGITDEMVKGKKIDDNKVTHFLDGVSIVIAHNAKFDRVFLEKRLPIFESLPWACTFAQIDWSEEGVGSAKLDYIAYKYDFFYDAHRAEVDCFALLEILQKQLPKSKELVLKLLLQSLHQKSYTISALGSPFETKDTLKAKGYRWNGDKKCWHNTLTGDDAIKEEVVWLKDNVYGGKPAKVEIEVLNCLTRFSNRSGNRGVRQI